MRGRETGSTHNSESRKERKSAFSRLRQLFASEPKRTLTIHERPNYPTWSVESLDQGYPIEFSYRAAVQDDADRRGVSYSEALIDFFCGNPEEEAPQPPPSIEITHGKGGKKVYKDSSGKTFYATD